LRNHGLLTTGRDLQEAYSRHETVEHYCRILHAARQAGPVGTIPDSDFQRLERMRAQREQASGGKKTDN
jgi:ribulose-5-phosphate 4-epimerase/fuculose-1-phosphate aldolase